MAKSKKDPAKVRPAAKAAKKEETPAAVAEFVMAQDAEAGERYLNWDLNAVVTLTGEWKHSNDGPGRRSFKAAAVYFNGDSVGEWWVKDRYPLRRDYADASTGGASMADHLAEVHKAAAARLAAAPSSKGRAYVEVTDTDPVSGLQSTRLVPVTKAGRAKGTRAASSRGPRGGKDPRTGCLVGTDGHAIGSIMLDQKAGPDHRKRCMPLIMAVLVKGGKPDDSKTRGLAASWYSTHFTKKAAIYGHLAGRGDSE